MQKFKFISVIILLFSPHIALADDFGFFFGANTNEINPTNSEFSSDSTYNLFLGLRYKNFILYEENSPRHEFKLQNVAGAKVTGRGNLLNFGYIFTFNKIEIETSIGQYDWKAKAYISNEFIAETNDESTVYNLGIGYPLFNKTKTNNNLNLGLIINLNYQKILDFSEQDLEIYKLKFQVRS